MDKRKILIENIPSILWGKDSDKIILAVHGKMSNKEDVPIDILAEVASDLGYQVISFDFPKHGDRKNSFEEFEIKACLKDIKTIYKYALNWKEVSLFANSIGAYFSLMVLKESKINKALFLSPVVNLESLIDNMMMSFDISIEELKEKKKIILPIGEILYWDYYKYVLENPVNKWPIDTSILYGEKDEMIKYEDILDFTNKFNGDLVVNKNSKHYFHTKDELNEIRYWIKDILT